MVSGRVGGAFASKGGREGGCGRRRGVREGWSAWSLGSSSVERAHNLLNGVWPLGGVEAEELFDEVVVFLSTEGATTKGK